MKTIPAYIKNPNKNRNGIFDYLPQKQDKGLREDVRSELMGKAYADDYGAFVDDLVIKWAKIQALKESAKKNRKLIFAEIGGGFGCFHDKVNNICANYLNIEPSDLEDKFNFSARLNKSNYFQLKASAEEIPITDSEVDITIALASLDHIPNIDRAIAEIARILKPGGILIFSLNNKGSWWKKLLRNSKRLKKRESEILKDHYVLWDTNDAKEAMKGHLTPEYISTICHCPQIPYAWKAIINPANFLGSMLAPRLGSNIVAIFRKPL